MPQYTLENKRSHKQKEVTMTIAEMEEYIVKNPNWFVVINPLGVRDNFVASRHTNIPIDEDFRSMLKNMKSANRGSTIDW